MTDLQRSPPQQETSPRQNSDSHTPQSRKLAEWVSLGISAFLVLGLAGYLVFLVTQPRSPYVTLIVTPLVQQVQRAGDLYILPIEVRNSSPRTVRELKVQARQQAPDGQWHSREFTLKYLGAQGSQKVYLYFDHPPRAGQVTAQPLEYRLE